LKAPKKYLISKSQQFYGFIFGRNLFNEINFQIWIQLDNYFPRYNIYRLQKCQLEKNAFKVFSRISIFTIYERRYKTTASIPIRFQYRKFPACSRKGLRFVYLLEAGQNTWNYFLPFHALRSCNFVSFANIAIIFELSILEMLSFKKMQKKNRSFSTQFKQKSRWTCTIFIRDSWRFASFDFIKKNCFAR